jgi:hypothetical protein
MATPTQEQVRAEAERREALLKEYLSSPEYKEKLITRLKIHDACDHSIEAKANVWKLCTREDNPAEGCIFFVENFLWTFNPKADPKHFPFILFEFQKRAIREFVDHIDNGRDLLLEKSREMGASWLLFAAIALWYWLFRDGINFLEGSYKEALVDDKTIDSLLGKVDYELQQLPTWMMPKDFNPKKHRTHMKLYNPENGNLITGDTMNPNFGRGSRKTAIFFDELGFWQYAKDAWESSGDSTNCRIGVSTPDGYNYFALLRETGIDILRLHWSEHPLKDQGWYNYECSRRTAEEIAQELDISYTKSKTGRVYPEWNEENVTIGRFEYDPSKPLYVFWDFGKSDDTAMIWLQKHGNKSVIIDVYRNTGKNIDFYIPFVNGIITGDTRYAYTDEDMKIIREHREWRNATHFGDPAGRFQNNVTDDSVIDVLKKYGIIVNFKDAWKEFKVRKSATKRLIMDKIELNDNPRTKFFNMCMIQASYPSVKVNGVAETRSEKPNHDFTSHYRSSLEYGALGLEDINNSNVSKRQVFDKFKKRDNNPTGWGTRRVGRY